MRGSTMRGPTRLQRNLLRWALRWALRCLALAQEVDSPDSRRAAREIPYFKYDDDDDDDDDESDDESDEERPSGRRR